MKRKTLTDASVPQLRFTLLILNFKGPCPIFLAKAFLLKGKDLSPWKPFYVYIARLTANPVNLLRFMIVPSASNAQTCIVHARRDEPCIWRDEGSSPTNCDQFSSDPTVNAVHYKMPQRCDEQEKRHNSVKVSDKISNTDCHEENLLTCWQSLRACWTDILIRLRRWRTDSNSSTQINDQYTQALNVQGLKRENSKSRREMKCSQWTLLNSPKWNRPYRLRRTDFLTWHRLRQVKRSDDLAFVPDSTHRQRYQLAWPCVDIFEIQC